MNLINHGVYLNNMRTILLLAGMLAALTGQAQVKAPAPFVNGDRVVLAGNSITEAGFYGMYIWQYYQLHFPEKRITVLNGGIGGDVAGQINDRFELDIMRMQPSVLVLTFGMNDSRYFEYFNTPQEAVRKEAVATSFSSYQKLEKKLKALPKVRKIIMTSSPFDETRGGDNNKFTGKFKTMQAIAEFQKKAAEKNKWEFVDLLEPMTAINQREQQKDSMFTLTGPDRIHPGNAGHLAMAWLFLKAQGMAGKVVADVLLDAHTGKLIKSENSTVKDIDTAKGQVSFDYLAQSLPFPMDSTARVFENPQKQYEVLKVIPFTEEMNREMLTVTGLQKDKRYVLSIDGKSVGNWTGDEFEKGINLALVSSTPQYQQAQLIAELNLLYRDYEQKLRSYYWLQANYFKKHNMLFQDDQAAYDSAAVSKEWAVDSKVGNYAQARKKEVRAEWQKVMQTIADRIYTINKPVTHRFVIREKLSLSNALQSRMVIQQNKPFKVWGTAAPGQQVKVQAGWLSTTTAVTTDTAGRFIAIMDVPPAKKDDFTSYKLSVFTTGDTITLDNLLIGDLWFCSGQSNMQFPLQEDTNAAKEVPQANYPYIRLLRADLNFSATPIDELKGVWEICTPESAKKFSAVGYSFGKELFNTLRIPIGLIFSGIGASSAQAYVPQDVLEKDTMLNRVYLQPYLQSEKSKEKIDGGFSFEKVTRPFLLYNAMIHPFRHLSIKGFCWYQGEANRMERASYTRLTQALIEAWRSNFSQGQLPFYYVQVAPFFYDQEDPTLNDYAFFREAQANIAYLNNTGMVVTMDVGEAKDLHPKNKQPIGWRLAQLALNRTYARLQVPCEGPAYHHMEIKKNKVVIHFEPVSVASGLQTNDGKAPAHFTIAGANRVFHPAEAVIEGSTIVVSSPKVKKPVAVRYAFTNYPVTNLENKAHFPALPFRTDDFAE